MKFQEFTLPVTLAEAQAFVGANHRHSEPLRRHKFSIGVYRTLVPQEVSITEDWERRIESCKGQGLMGIATVDNCSSSWSKRLDHLEIRRVCTDGTPNLSSFLIGRATQACFALGARVVVTYTRPWESCSSPLAAGFLLDRAEFTPDMQKGIFRWVKRRDGERASERKFTKEVIDKIRQHRSAA
jgi:hypothetical protein